MCHLVNVGQILRCRFHPSVCWIRYHNALPFSRTTQSATEHFYVKFKRSSFKCTMDVIQDVIQDGTHRTQCEIETATGLVMPLGRLYDSNDRDCDRVYHGSQGELFSL